MMIDYVAIATRFANKMADEQIAEAPPEQLAKYTAADIQACRERLTKQLIETAAMIVEKGPAIRQRIGRGFLHPSNKNWRAMFTELTGVKLPPGAGDTFDVAVNWYGVERYYAEVAEIQRQKNEEELARQAAKDRAEAARVAALVAKFASGERICGNELVDVARSLGVSVNIRTIGTLRRITWKSGGC